MKKIDKIILIGFLSAIIVIVGLFLFSHFSPILSPAIGITHAQDLHTDLSPGPSSQTWIFTVWKVALALANVIVIVMLLFVAVVNIVHLQYDTYAIKKSLPLLIIGIIMANFSLLICRMIVDSAQVLTNTFASNPKELATGLLCSMGVVTKGSTLAIEMIPGVMATGLIIMIFVFILILIAVFILAFLLWIRKTVIFLLVAVAPVAFILYAFPPTQTLFKTWWGWFLKWTFMGPIVMLLVWVASVIGKTNCDAVTNVSGTTFSISALFATCGVLYLAAIVPFKLGGPVMGAWGGAGKWASMMGKGGAIRKKVDANIQRKKDIANGAVSTAIGNTRLGRWSDSGLKNEEGLIANYKNRRDTQLTNQEHAVRNRHADFAENEKALERAKGRLETTIKSQIGLYIRNNGAAIGQEALNSKNAAGDVDRETANAEGLARGPVDSEHAVTQRLQEKEVEFAKTRLEESVQGTEALIREGAINNIPPARLQEIYGATTLHAGRATDAMDIKSRYLEQDNRLDNLKERLTKEASEDAQALAQRDLNQNDDIRNVSRDLHAAGLISVTSDYELNGDRVAGGGTVPVSDDQAVEASERLKYEATTATDPAEQTRLLAVAQHLDDRVRQSRSRHVTYTQQMVDHLSQSSDQEAIAYETRADAVATQAQTIETQAAAERAAGNTADADQHDAEAVVLRREETDHRNVSNQAMARSTQMRSRVGQNIHYEHLLSRNLSGRRMKKINPDISDEIYTQEISNSPGELIEQVRQGAYGSGRARGDTRNFNNVLTGNMDQNSESANRAAIIQVGSIHSNMKTARHGEAAGLASIQGFNDLMTDAGRGNFKVAAARNAIDAMNPTLRANIQMEAARQATDPTTWNSMSAAQQAAAWGTLGADGEEVALQNLNFSQLDVKSQANTGQRDFVDRYLTQVEEDPAMSLSASPGSRLGRSRGIDPARRTENRPLTPPPPLAPTPTPSPTPTTQPQPPAPRSRQNRPPLRGRQGPRIRRRPRP